MTHVDRQPLWREGVMHSIGESHRLLCFPCSCDACLPPMHHHALFVARQPCHSSAALPHFPFLLLRGSLSPRSRRRGTSSTRSFPCNKPKLTVCCVRRHREVCTAMLVQRPRSWAILLSLINASTYRQWPEHGSIFIHKLISMQISLEEQAIIDRFFKAETTTHELQQEQNRL